MIKPTIGRKVWYRPLPDEAFNPTDETERWDASIVRVWSDTTVNLAVWDPNGTYVPHSSVVLSQETADPGHCEWMPFQKAQAAAPQLLPPAGTGGGGTGRGT